METQDNITNESLQNARKIRRSAIILCCVIGIFVSIFIMVLYQKTRKSGTETAYNEIITTASTNFTDEGNFFPNFFLIFSLVVINENV